MPAVNVQPFTVGPAPGVGVGVGIGVTVGVGVGVNPTGVGVGVGVIGMGQLAPALKLPETTKLQSDVVTGVK